MKNLFSKSTTVTALLALNAGLAHASPSDLAIDSTQSSLNLDITLVIGSSVTSTDSSSLSGTITVDLDDPTTPTTITLHDFQIEIDQVLDFYWSFGFLGSANASMTNPAGTGAGSLFFDPLAMPIPSPLVASAFSFPQVPTKIAGIVDASYNILFVGNNSVTVDLSTMTTAASDMPGSATLVDDQLTVTTSILFSGEQPLVDDTGAQIGTILFDGNASIVATGTFNSCAADFNSDGLVDIADVFAFLNAFNTMDPSADLTNDGIVDISDVFGFLNSYTTGCP